MSDAIGSTEAHLPLRSGPGVRPFRIGGQAVGPGNPCYIIAEAGVNHNGDPALALKLADVAADAGADAVKFQTFRADALATREAPRAAYQARNTGVEESQHAMLRRLEMTAETHERVLDRCRARGIAFLSTPFDEGSADYLETLGVPAFKIPSGEITNMPFLAHVAQKGRPMVVSTGMSRIGEVDEAVQAIRRAGLEDFALLHCVSDYPAAPADANLRAMATLTAAFGVPVGYSDHTMGTEMAVAAVALGAHVVEKHFTLDRALPGPDHKASLEPAELGAMVRAIRNVEAGLGTGLKEPTARERETAAVARKSVVAARPLAVGAILTRGVLAVKRPGTGLPPAALERLVGRRVRRALPEGALLAWEDVE